MIETVILAGLLATAGGLVLWLSHWIRRHIEVRYRPTDDKVMVVRHMHIGGGDLTITHDAP